MAQPVPTHRIISARRRAQRRLGGEAQRRPVEARDEVRRGLPLDPDGEQPVPDPRGQAAALTFFAFGAPPERFVILGDANLDPVDGEGLHADLAALLADPRLQDPRPASEGGRAAADPGQGGDPALDTADWDGPGNLRTSYVLPAAGLRVTGAGVVWPRPGDPLSEAVAAAGPHRLVWADLEP